MNTSSLLIHLMLKDLSAFRTHLLLLWLVIVTAVITPLHAQGAGAIMVMAAFILLFLAQALLIQLDPARGTEHFLTTRPVPKTALLCSKLMLFLLCGIAPIIVGALIQLALAKLDASFADYAWICVRSAVLYMGVAGLLALVASFTGNVPRFIGCVVAMAILLLIGMATLTLSFSRTTSAYLRVDEFLVITRLYLSVLLCGVTCYIVVILRYLHWSWKAQGVVVAAGVVLITVCFKSLPVSLIPLRKPSVVQSTQITEAARDVKIQLKMQDGSHATSTVNGVNFTNLQGVFIVENLPKKSFIAERNSRATAVVSGDKMASEVHGSVLRKRDYRIPGLSVMALLDIPASDETVGLHEERRNLTATIFSYRPEKLPGANDRIPLIAESDFDLFEPVIVAELPLKEGSAFVKDGARAEVVRLNLNDRYLTLQWRASLVGTNVVFDGAGFSMNDYFFYVVNPGKKQMLKSQGGGSSNIGLNLAAIVAADCRTELYLQDQKGREELLTDEWLEGAKIFVIQAMRQTSFTRTFEVEAKRGKSAK